MKTIIKPTVYAAAGILVIWVTAFFACSKSSDDGYGNGGGDSNSSGSAVSIKYMAFSVGSLTITAGTTVTWTNNDATTHTVTADDGSFDSGDIAAGGKYSRKFTTTGTFAYHCSFHPMMTATVKVNY